MVVDFFVVVSFFAAVSFLVVAVVEPDGVFVVVVDSCLLVAHDVIKPMMAKTAMDVISDCFIGLVNECRECPAEEESASIN